MTRTIKICVADIVEMKVIEVGSLVKVYTRPDEEDAEWMSLIEGREFTVETTP